MTETTVVTSEATISLKHHVRIDVKDGPLLQLGRRVPEQLVSVRLNYTYDFDENVWLGSPTVLGRRVKKDGNYYLEAPQQMYAYHNDAGEEIRQFAHALMVEHRPATKHTLTTEAA